MIEHGFTSADFVIKPERLAVALISKMDRLWASQPHAGNREWTRQVKQFLYEIAADLQRSSTDQIQAVFTDSEPEAHEFLLDVVWWCRRATPTREEFMALAAEIEWAFLWGRGDVTRHITQRVGEDFDKLVVMKAPIKLMVFCTEKSGAGNTHEPIQQAVLAEIDRYLAPYKHHIPGEVYLLIDVASAGNRRAWIRRVDSNGSVSPLEQLQLEVILSSVPGRQEAAPL